MSASDVLAAWARDVAPTYGTPRLVLERGRGRHVWDANGRRYLDFLAGIAVSATGHAHPRVTAAITAQVERLVHVSNLYATGPNVRLAGALKARTGLDRVFFANSGAEANECAVKLARRHAVRHLDARDAVIIAFTGSFHGRTLATVTLTGQDKHKRDFDPLPGGIVHVPFNDADALERVFREHTVAAVFTEFVQGESGVVPMDPAFARTLQGLTRAHDALLVADEVQTGVGRTGRFLAAEHYGVTPDVVTLAKGLGSGVPIGACAFTERLAPLLGPGDHGSTFGGNPLASAAALATLHVLDAEKLPANASARGAELKALLADVPGVTDARGLGLLAGATLATPTAARVREDAERAGLLVGNVGDRVLRFAPPLTVTSSEVQEAAHVIEKVVTASA